MLYPSPSGESINKTKVEEYKVLLGYKRYPSPNGESINKTLVNEYENRTTYIVSVP